METWTLMLAQAEDAGQATDTTATETSTTEPGDQGEQTEKKKPGFLEGPIFPIALMLLVMYFLLFRGPKKKQQKQKQMLDSVKKNDRVRTIGGILATVVDVRDNEVVLKIDEANNTKMRLARSAIAQIITDTEEKEKK